MSPKRLALCLGPSLILLGGLALTGCKQQPEGDGQTAPTSAPPRPPGSTTARPLPSEKVGSEKVGSEKVGSTPGGSAPSPPVRNAASQIFGGGKMTIDIAEAGDEPRTELRYAPVDVDREAKLAVALEPPNGHGLRIGLGLNWTSAGEGMSFAVTEALVGSEDGATKGPQQAMFQRMRSGFTRVRGTVEAVDGRQLRLTQREGQPTTPPVPWLLHAIMVPLPSEPVGVGATWTVHEPIDASGRKGQSQRRYALKEKDGERLVVTIGGSDVWKAAGGRADGTTTLSGTVTVTLKDPLPTEADLDLVEKVEAEGKAPKGKTSLHVGLGGTP